MYSIARIPRFLSSNRRVWIINDAPPHQKQGQKILERYLCDARDVFQKEIAVVADITRTFTETDEHRLIRMLALLIDSRKAWEEEQQAIDNA